MKGLIPTRVGGTRWLTHLERAIHVIIVSYPALVDQLNAAKIETPKAGGLVKILTNAEI